MKTTLRRLREEWEMTVRQMAAVTGLTPAAYYPFDLGVRSPLTTRGKWTTTAQTISGRLRRLPEDLFPEAVQQLEEARPEVLMAPHEIQRLIEARADGGTPTTPEEACQRRMLGRQVDRVLATLTPREEDVARRRSGLTDRRVPESLHEVGRVHGVTRESIRRVEARALRKLRHPSRAKYLRPYYEDSPGYVLDRPDPAYARWIARRRARQVRELRELERLARVADVAVWELKEAIDLWKPHDLLRELKGLPHKEQALRIQLHVRGPQEGVHDEYVRRLEEAPEIVAALTELEHSLPREQRRWCTLYGVRRLLAHRRPLTQEDLLRVPGFGARRLDCYGERVLAIMNQPASPTARPWFKRSVVATSAGKRDEG